MQTISTEAQGKAISFTLANGNGKLSLEVNGADIDETLFNLVSILKETIDSLEVDAEALSY